MQKLVEEWLELAGQPGGAGYPEDDPFKVGECEAYGICADLLAAALEELGEGPGAFEVAMRCQKDCDAEYPEVFRNGWAAACEYVAHRLSAPPGWRPAVPLPIETNHGRRLPDGSILVEPKERP